MVQCHGVEHVKDVVFVCYIYEEMRMVMPDRIEESKAMRITLEKRSMYEEALTHRNIIEAKKYLRNILHVREEDMPSSKQV